MKGTEVKTMGFMQLQSDFFKAYIVETTHGGEIVPCYLLGRKMPDVGQCGEDDQTCDALQDYCEGEVESYKVVEGWFARYSAPGYLDCTEWVGPCCTEEEAIAEGKDLYGDNEEQEDLP
jgi:hypothetical protein